MIRTTLFSLLLVSAFSATGCTTLGLSSLWGSKTFEADARHPVTEVMCLWEAAEGTGLDGLPTRGFVGQVLFFTAGRPSPAKVDGEIRVFVFDDQGVNGDRAIPLHQFDFPGAAWNAFLTTTNFGTAYQLFIPYTRPGGMHADCEIRVRYTPKDGNPVYSRPCTVNLAGPRASSATAGRTGAAGRGGSGPGRQPILQASHEEPALSAISEPRQLPSEIRLGRNQELLGAQNAKVDRLNRLASALVDEGGHSQPETEQPPPAAGGRRRLQSSAATVAPAAAEVPVEAPEASESEAHHLLLD